MKLSTFIATAISTATVVAGEHLDVRSCVCSSNKSSCLCEDAKQSVRVLPDAVSKCIASRGWKDGEDTTYSDNSCGVTQKYADIACIVSRDAVGKSFPGDWCGGAQKRADMECSASKRSADNANEPEAKEACTAAQKRAIDCIVSRDPEGPSPGDWCGGAVDAVEEHCGTPSAGQETVEGFPGDWCGGSLRLARDCISVRSPKEVFPPDWCGRKRGKPCIVSRSPKEVFPPDWCGRKRGKICPVSRTSEKRYPPNWCGGTQKRATQCIVSRGWTGYPWDVCDSTDAECIAAAKRELGYDMEVKHESASADACDYSSRGGRRAVTPPHCMCPVERDEAGVDVVKRCRCGDETKEVATYHCMCLTGGGDATAPCACNKDVAFLSKVQYEQ
ncbi:hypothetical protein LEL_09119 [Akanthomyces lecanii RCEF 1005]|uniref:Extracellular membrane protein, CFEM domain protein n=1 Tax=Akanthomyces lecanii RCEF 1005 TaxID=1081108 RepID=A0A162LKH0_CORDF|nr:hypothetical protein LEL_09119 [Akanthomyces lecanii RCEF 1005]